METVRIFGFMELLVDSIVHADNVPEGEEGSHALVQMEMINDYLSGKDFSTFPGGCGTNVFKAMARLTKEETQLNQIKVFGYCGDDTGANTYRTGLESLGITSELQTVAEKATGACLSVVTPNKERTFYTHLGAAKNLSLDDVTQERIEAWKKENQLHVHFEGFSAFNGDFLKEAVDRVKSWGATVSLCLDGADVVKVKKQVFSDLISQGKIDILIGNQAEMTELSAKDAEDACQIYGETVGTVVTTMGVNGCWIKDASGTVKHYPAKQISASDVVDTTGAGDYFSGGIIHGVLHRLPTEQTVKLANTLAGAIIQVDGADLPDASWDAIKGAVTALL